MNEQRNDDCIENYNNSSINNDIVVVTNTDERNEELGSTTTAKNDGVVVNWYSVRALELRYRFVEHNFYGLVWKSLQCAGWTYRQYDTKYCAPSISFFSSSSLFSSPNIIIHNNNNNNHDKNILTTNDDDNDDNNNAKTMISIKHSGVLPLDVNQVKVFLDQTATPLVFSNVQQQQQQQDNVHNSNEISQFFDTDLLFNYNIEPTMIAKKLRFDVLYQMQLLLQRSAAANAKATAGGNQSTMDATKPCTSTAHEQNEDDVQQQVSLNNPNENDSNNSNTEKEQEEEVQDEQLNQKSVSTTTTRDLRSNDGVPKNNNTNKENYQYSKNIIQSSKNNNNNNDNNHTSTSTSLEKGSDLYFFQKHSMYGKSKKKVKQQKNQNQHHHNDSSILDTFFVSSTTPSITDCIQFMDTQVAAAEETLDGKMCNDHSTTTTTTRTPLEEEYNNTKMFQEWRFLLTTNHSLLLYGTGSKYNILETFATTELCKEGYTLILNGFDSNLTSIDSILDLFVTIFLNGIEPPQQQQQQSTQQMNSIDTMMMITDNITKNNNKQLPFDLFDSQCVPRIGGNTVVDRAIAIGKAIASITSTTTYIPIFLVLHSMDGLLSKIKQYHHRRLFHEALTSLINHSIVVDTNNNSTNNVATIRLIASVDHVDYYNTISWDTKSFYLYKWIIKQVHTYEPYIQELALLLSSDEEKGTTLTTKGRNRNNNNSKLTKEDTTADMNTNNQQQRFFDVICSLPPRCFEMTKVLAQLHLSSESINNSGGGGGNDNDDKTNNRKTRMNKNRKRKYKTMNNNNNNHDHDDDNNWIDFRLFRTKCQQMFIVSTDDELRKLIHELIDHRLYQYKIDDECEYVKIVLPSSTISTSTLSSSEVVVAATAPQYCTTTTIEGPTTTTEPSTTIIGSTSASSFLQEIISYKVQT